MPFAIAIAKLEANNWINRIDASNAPINFSEFLGLEIDTLGNLWVADNLYIHTLLTANSPVWLGLTSNNPLEEMEITPNPSNGIFQVSSISAELMKIVILDQQGKQVVQVGSSMILRQLGHSFVANFEYAQTEFCHYKFSKK